VAANLHRLLQQGRVNIEIGYQELFIASSGVRIKLDFRPAFKC
jgi:hypothetical protein